MPMGSLLAAVLETIADLLFFGAPHSRRTTWVLAAIGLALAILLAWGLWALWAPSR